MTAEWPIERKAGGCCWATANCEGTDVKCLSNPTANWSLRWCSASLLYTSNCICWTHEFLKVESFAPGPNWRPIRVQQLDIANASTRCWQEALHKIYSTEAFFISVAVSALIIVKFKVSLMKQRVIFFCLNLFKKHRLVMSPVQIFTRLYLISAADSTDEVMILYHAKQLKVYMIALIPAWRDDVEDPSYSRRSSTSFF